MLNNDVGAVRRLSCCESLWRPCAMTDVRRNVIILLVSGIVFTLGGGAAAFKYSKSTESPEVQYKYIGQGALLLGITLGIMATIGAVLDQGCFTRIRHHQQQLLALRRGIEMVRV